MTIEQLQYIARFIAYKSLKPSTDVQVAYGHW